MAVRCVVLVWAPRCVCLPVPPPFPWGREPVAAHLGALGGFSSRGILGVRRTGLRCIVLVSAPRGVCLPHPPAFPMGKVSRSLRSDVALGGCCFRAFCCRAAVVFVVVLFGRSALVCRQTPFRFVLRFPSFRPRTPCFSNPLVVSQERHNYVLSSVLKTDVSTAIPAKSQSIRAFLDSRVLTVHFRSLAGAE